MFSNQLSTDDLNSKDKNHPKTNILKQACEIISGFAELNEKFKRKMTISGNAERTCTSYSRCIARIALYHKRLPTLLSNEEIDDYLYYVKQKKIPPSETYFKHTIYGLRFLFRMEGLEEMHIKLPKIKRVVKLPVVLSKTEIVNMLNKTNRFKHKVLIALLYGCGLRCGEVRNIKTNDIDFHRSVLHVRQGKGKKDRYMPLGFMLTSILKIYVDIYKPGTWLFSGKQKMRNRFESNNKYAHRSIQSAIKISAKMAGVLKDINVHTLRHSFATHLLEDGLDIGSIKELLGHARIENTLVYLHVAQISRKDKCSPIDNLQGVRIMQGVQSTIDFSRSFND